jgi:hypothetical protein
LKTTVTIRASKLTESTVNAPSAETDLQVAMDNRHKAMLAGNGEIQCCRPCLELACASKSKMTPVFETPGLLDLLIFALAD